MATRWAVSVALTAAAALVAGCEGSAPDASPRTSAAPALSPSAPPASPGVSPADDATLATTPEPTPSRGVAASRADTWRVVSVTDGDTLDVRRDGTLARVRLIGINAPESNECFADEAERALAELVAGEDVELVRDVSERDRYGRLLAYVFVDDVHVNAELVRGGYAIAREYPPDTSRADELAAAQGAAEDAGAGMWGPDGCVSQRADVSVSLTVQPDAPGDDNTNLNGEWVDVRNDGDERLDLSGWRIKDESASHRYTFPGGTTVAPGASLRLHTGCGEDTATERYWCNTASAVWNNSGDTAFLLDPDGRTVATSSY